MSLAILRFVLCGNAALGTMLRVVLLVVFLWSFNSSEMRVVKVT